mgnify:CR=1 FL=1
MLMINKSPEGVIQITFRLCGFSVIFLFLGEKPDILQSWRQSSTEKYKFKQNSQVRLFFGEQNLDAMVWE